MRYIPNSSFEREQMLQQMGLKSVEKTARTSIAKLREITDKTEAEQFLPKVISMIDKLAKKNTWHPNKAANLKSSLMKHISTLN